MIAQTLSLLIQCYTLMLLARIISSWVPELQETQIIKFISFYTDPYLNLFRKVIPTIGFIDISPIFAFFGLELLRMGILSIL